jgi:hypothetical protein
MLSSRLSFCLPQWSVSLDVFNQNVNINCLLTECILYYVFIFKLPLLLEKDAILFTYLFVDTAVMNDFLLRSYWVE